MHAIKVFSAASAGELWQQVAADMNRAGEPMDYRAELHQPGYQVHFGYDIDVGGGFEGGYAETTFTAKAPGSPGFHFTLHEQDWVHELGKLLGLTDIQLGDPEVDEAFIINTNNQSALQALLARPEIRQTLLRYQPLRLDLMPVDTDAGRQDVLSFSKDAPITEVGQLREVYDMLLAVLQYARAISGGQGA